MSFARNIRLVVLLHSLKSFLSSLNFSVHVLGLSEAAAASNSARVVGIARAAYLSKKKTVRRPPLTAKMVAALERLVCDAQASAIDRVCAGFFLICVFMRARYSDGLNMGCISVDRVPGAKLEGYLEAGVERSFTAERKTDSLSMVCPLRGITDLDWYDQWDQVRHASGVPSGPGIPLLPARAVSGWALYLRVGCEGFAVHWVLSPCLSGALARIPARPRPCPGA